jgi:hypothetical protein
VVSFPYGGLEPLSRGVGNGYVWEEVVVVVGNEGVGEKCPKGMVGTGGEDVVRQGTTAAVSGPCWIIEERFEGCEAALKVRWLVIKQRGRGRKL